MQLDFGLQQRTCWSEIERSEPFLSLPFPRDRSNPPVFFASPRHRGGRLDPTTTTVSKGAVRTVRTELQGQTDIPYIGGQSLATGRSARSYRQVPRSSSFVSRVLDSRLHHEQVRGGHGRGRRGRSGGRGQSAQEEDEHDQERERNQALARLPEKLKRNNCLYNFNITQCIEFFFFGKNLDWKSKAFQF